MAICFKYRITAFLCMSLCAIPLLYSGFFLLRQYHIRSEMEEKLEDHFVQVISLHKKDVHWVEENKELRIKGHLFDVKSITLIGDSVQLIGLYDEQEDSLCLELEKNMQKKGRDHTCFRVEKELHIIFIHPDAEGMCFDQSAELPKVSSFFNAPIASVSLPLHSPPPRS